MSFNLRPAVVKGTSNRITPDEFIESIDRNCDRLLKLK